MTGLDATDRAHTERVNVSQRANPSRTRLIEAIRPAHMQSASDRLHLGQVIADRLGAAANTRIGALKVFVIFVKFRDSDSIGMSPPLVGE